MPQSANALALPFEFEFEGKTYKFASMRNLEVIALYECHLEDMAWKAVARSRKFVDDELFDKIVEKTQAEVAAGGYAHGTKGYQKSLQNNENLKHMIYLMGVKQDPSFDRDVVERMDKDVEATRRFFDKAVGSLPEADQKKVAESLQPTQLSA